MSLSVAGVWQVGVWDQTVWADGVWREGDFVPSNVSINKMLAPFDKKIMYPITIDNQMAVEYKIRKMTV